MSSRSRRRGRFSGVVGKAEANVDWLKGGHDDNVPTLPKGETDESLGKSCDESSVL